MRKNIERLGYSLGIIVLSLNVVYGQGQKSGLTKAKEILEEIKNSKEISYDYLMTAQYPNGKKDELNGTVYISNIDRRMFNDNSAFTMLYGSRWFYKADHIKKTVSIIDMNKEYDHDLKVSIEKDLFGNRVLIEFVDSILMKYGKLKSYDAKDDTIKLEITFPTNDIRGISIVFDSKQKRLVNYTVATFRVIGESGDNEKGISQTILCDNFRKKWDKGIYDQDKFFQWSNGNVTLRKYDRYKLTTKL